MNNTLHYLIALALGLSSACGGEETSETAEAAHENMDHEGMDHEGMEGMDHEAMEGMNHEGMEGMEGMDHEAMEGMEGMNHEGMDHGAMNHEGMQATELADSSVYQVGGEWTDQQGQAFELGSLQGHPTVVLFYYGHCEHFCPTLIHDVQNVERALSEETRANTRFLLVTIDPERDSPAARLSMSEEKEMSDRFVLINADEMHTRGFAALMGVQYRDNRNGTFSHTNVLGLLDPSGVPNTRLEGLNQPNAEFVAAIEAM